MRRLRCNRSENERDVLAEEISHRMKERPRQSRSVIVKQSLRHVPQIEQERQSIEARLSALSGAQDVLTRAEDRNADILSVIETTLAPHVPQTGQDRDRRSIAAAEVRSGSWTVSRACTSWRRMPRNTVPCRTRLERSLIDWRTDPDGRFEFSWTERDGPKVKATDAKGFGSHDPPARRRNILLGVTRH